jgi:hypothetical protein
MPLATYSALLIPADRALPMRIVSLPKDSLTTTYELLDCEIVEVVALADDAEFVVDETGRWKKPTRSPITGQQVLVNERASMLRLLWAEQLGAAPEVLATSGRLYALVGDVLVVGRADDDGDFTSAPAWALTLGSAAGVPVEGVPV